MEPEGLLLWSQGSAAGPCSEPDELSPPHSRTIFKTHFNLASRLCFGLQSPSVLFPKPYAFFSSPLRSTFLTQLFLVDLITLKYLVRYRSHEPPLHNFLRPAVPSSLLGPNTLLNPAPVTSSVFFPYCHTPRFPATQTTGKLQRTYCGNYGRSGTGFTFCADFVVSWNMKPCVWQ
jgi:hypothetical protein